MCIILDTCSQTFKNGQVDVHTLTATQQATDSDAQQAGYFNTADNADISCNEWY